MSHFQDNGLLHEAQPKSKSSSTSPSHISRSWMISEVLPPSGPSRPMSPERVDRVRRKFVPEEETTTIPTPAPVHISHRTPSLSRSDSVVTQVYSPRHSSPPFEKQRAREGRNSRALSGLRASTASHGNAWEPRLSARGMASPKSPRCTCGAIVQDARLQSTYFPDTKAPQKPLPDIPDSASVSMRETTQDVSIQEQSSTPRFELEAPNSPRQMPATEAPAVKPIRRMAPSRSPTAMTPNPSHASTSWPLKPEPTNTTSLVQDSPTSSFSRAGSNPRLLLTEDSPTSSSNSRPLSTSGGPSLLPTTPPPSPSLSIFSFTSNKLPHQDQPPYTRIPIYDKDTVLLPWNDPNMGPALFCSSPPPTTPLHPPPSPGSSIDDATPPPIPRTRRSPSLSNPKSNPKSKPRHQSQPPPRPRALSSPSSTQQARPQSFHAPPLPSSARRHQTHTYSLRRPSLDIRPEPPTAVPYSDTTAGPEPIATSERIAPPPPLSGALIRAGRGGREVEKGGRWGRGRLRGMFGLGLGIGGKGAGLGLGMGMGGGRDVDAKFMRSLVRG
ncbi:MAG: hypothetical protein HETSPECPRED_004314 [Heterodermia speciosa]|uniref:Uncharacterized protein n=1 Tax=Heterodermia speciosa TaxID=116794 RepID=A0A8H3FA68_9LECA|nr:MAG: hypothetical protein HETSPECPRED_004314 [Heterodermia speciosa]